MKKQNPRSAFTLIEMMIVVAIIGILIGGIFRLISAAGDNTSRAATIKRIEKLQNALAGYYAAYGTYPPVEKIRSGDPSVADDGTGQKDPEEGNITKESAKAACGAQPIAFAFPNKQMDNQFVKDLIEQRGLKGISGYDLFCSGTVAGETWQEDEARTFKFGVLSYLLPRVEIMGGADYNDEHSKNVFNCKRWTKNNDGSVESVRSREKICAKWLENFQGELNGGPRIWGIDTHRPHTEQLVITDALKAKGNSVCLQEITMRDNWENPIYYYSAPPYSSYRVWSAGPDGNTFPPWIKVNALSPEDQKKVAEWTRDDISRFDH